MKQIYLIILGLFLGYLAGQGQTIAPTLQVLEQPLVSSDQVNQYVDTLRVIRPSLSANQKITYYQKGIKAADQLSLTNPQLNLRLYLSDVFLSLDSLSKAINILEKAMDIAIAANHESVVDIPNNIAVVYSILSDYDRALDYYFQSVNYADSFGVHKAKSYALGNIGQIFIYRKEYERSKTYLEEGLNLGISLDDPGYGPSVVYNNSRLGDIYKATQQTDSSLFYYQTALQQAKHIKDPSLLSSTFSKLSQFYLEAGQYEIASVYQDSSVKYYDPRRMPGYLSNPLLNGARILLQQGRFNEVEEALQSLDLQNLNFEGKKDYYKLLIEANKAKGAFKQALDYQSDLFTLTEKISGDKIQRYISFTEAQFQSAKRERAIKDLQQKHLLDQATIQRQQVMTVGAILAFLSILIFTILLYRNYLQKKRFNSILNQKVQEKTEELEQSNGELKHFNYIVSHDLKEPLRNIVSFSSLLKKKIKLTDPTSGEYLDIITGSSKQLYLLIKDVLEFQKIDTLSVGVEPVNTQHIVEEAQSFLSELVQQSEGQVITQTPLPMIHSSKGHLLIVFKNIIENGLKYNRSSTPEVTISYLPDQSDRHVFEFNDNGIGMEEQYFEHVFEMFKRLNTRDQFQGTGLGLSICQKLLQKLEGSLKIVDSRIDNGTTFRLTLPKNKSIESNIPEEKAPAFTESI